MLVARKRSRPPADPLAAAGALAAANPERTSAGDAPGSVPIRARSRADRGTPGRSSPGRDRVGAGAGARARRGRAAPRAMSLKAGWLAKHRRLRPALALVFLDRADVEGDPNRRISLSTQPTPKGKKRRQADCKLAVVEEDEDGVDRKGAGRSPTTGATDGATAREAVGALEGAGDAVAAADTSTRLATGRSCARRSARNTTRRHREARAARTHVDDDAQLGGERERSKPAHSRSSKGLGRSARWYGRAQQAGRRRARLPEPPAPRKLALSSLTGNPLAVRWRLGCSQARHWAAVGCRERGVQEVRAVADARPGRRSDAVAHWAAAHAAAFKKQADVAAARVPPRTPRVARVAVRGVRAPARVARRVGAGGARAGPRPAGRSRRRRRGRPPPPARGSTHAAANAAEARRRSLEAAMDASGGVDVDALGRIARARARGEGRS